MPQRGGARLWALQQSRTAAWSQQRRGLASRESRIWCEGTRRVANGEHLPCKMLQGLLAPLLLAASFAVVASVPLSEQCEVEMNEIKDLLQVSCVEKGLSSIPTGLPKDTGILLLASNQLAEVALASFQHLPQLNELDLSNNSLKVLETGATLPKLEYLYLSHNALESLPAFPGLPILKRLVLGHNQLSQLPEGGFRDLGELSELQLQGNRLQSLPGRAFEGLEMLKDLDLSDNCLESLPPELLSWLPDINILRLERNRLERVPDGFFAEAVFLYVYLVGNPWLCDCRLVYLRDWISDNEYTIYTRVNVQVNGLYKEVTESHILLCQAPPKEKGQPVNSFQAVCRKPGDDDQEAEEEEEPADDSWPPSPAPSPLTATAPLTPRLSSHSPSTAISPTAAAPTTSTSALSSSTTHSPTTTSPGSTTTFPVLTTTTAVVPFSLSTRGATMGRSSPTSNVITMTPGPTTTHTPPTPPRVSTTTGTPCTLLAHSPTALMLTTPLSPSTPLPTTTPAVVPFGLPTRGATAGRSSPTSNVITMTPGPTTTHTPPTPPRVSTTTGTPCTLLAHSPTASMLTTPLSPSAPAPTTTAAGHPLSPAALDLTTSTHVKSSPGISASLSTRDFSPPPPPKPSAHCLCPAPPVKVLGVAARKESHAGWLAGSCCLLRLGLYLACLVLVALPTLTLLCWLGWLHHGWYRPAPRGAPWPRQAGLQQWQKASPKEWQLKFAEAPRPPSGPRIYRVCKKFRVAPSRHVTWLLVSLPGSAGKWAQMQARLSSYSLDRGKDTLGTVRVKYAAASL